MASRWRLVVRPLLLALALTLFLVGSAQANGSVSVTIQVDESNGSTPISGVAISYLDGYWKGLGTTNGNGQVTASLPAQSWQFRAEYLGTSATRTQDVGSNPNVTFYTSEATIQVNESGGDPLSGVAISYLAGYYRGIGSTDANGEATAERFPGTYTFRAEYGGTSASRSMTLAGDGVNSGSITSVTFHTSKVTVVVADCDTTPLPGVAISYLAGYYRGIGSTDGSGEATAERFPGTYTFRAEYGGTSASQSMTLAGDGVAANQGSIITFNPTKVTMLYGGSKAYLAGYWRGFSGPIYMFPGTYTFKFGSY